MKKSLQRPKSGFFAYPKSIHNSIYKDKIAKYLAKHPAKHRGQKKKDKKKKAASSVSDLLLGFQFISQEGQENSIEKHPSEDEQGAGQGPHREQRPYHVQQYQHQQGSVAG